MRAVVGAVVVAVWAYRSGLKQGNTEGQIRAMGQLTSSYLAGLRQGYQEMGS